MADNTTLNTGSGGDTLRTEDRTTYKTPVSLIDVGGTSGEALIGDGGNAMPVAGAAAEDAAASGNPILVGGRYDLLSRSLDSGDTGAIALTSAGHVLVSNSGLSNLDLSIGTAGITGPNKAVSIGGTDSSGALREVMVDSDGAVHISDGGNTITVDGSVSLTGDLPDTAAGDLAAIAAALAGSLDVSGATVTVANSGLTALDAAINSSRVDVNIAADGVSLATAANQSTANTWLGLMTTSLAILDDQMKTEGNPYTPGQTASYILGKRSDTAAANGGVANGDYCGFIFDATQRLWVHVGAVDGGTIDTITNAVTVNLSATDNAVLDTIASPVATISSTPLMRMAIFDDSDSQITSFGGGTEYTEDAAAAANPVGKANILVRQDTPAGLTTTDGDNVAQRGTNYGAAFVQILDSSGNFINSFGGSGGTSHADDAAFSIGSASSITPTGFLADETTPDSVDEGDVGVPRMTLTRKPYAVITDATSENNAGVDGSGHLQVDIAADSVGIGGGTQYTEDDAAAANPVGNAAIMVRDDALSGQTTTDGDNIAQRGSNYGAAYVTLADGSGNILDDFSGGILVNLGGNNDVVATSVGTVAHDSDAGAVAPLILGGVARTSVPTGVGNNDAVWGYFDESGYFMCKIHDGGNTITVDNGGTFAVQAAQAGTWNVATVTTLTGITNDVNIADGGNSITVDLGAAAAALADNTSNPTTALIGSCLMVFDGANWDRASGNSASGLRVSGTDISGAADSGSAPFNVGFHASASVSGDVMVDDNDIVAAVAGVDGVQITRNHCGLEDIVSERDTNTDGASTAFGSGLAAPGSGVTLYITSVTIANSSSTFCTVDLRDGAAGSVLWTFPVPGEGGVTHTFDPPLKLTANTALAYDASAAISTLYISGIGFTSKI